MKNHLYRFDGQVSKQTSVGPIGLELTQVLAWLVMLWWDEQFKTLLADLQLQLDMYLRYVYPNIYFT